MPTTARASERSAAISGSGQSRATMPLFQRPGLEKRLRRPGRRPGRPGRPADARRRGAGAPGPRSPATPWPRSRRPAGGPRPPAGRIPWAAEPGSPAAARSASVARRRTGGRPAGRGPSGARVSRRWRLTCTPLPGGGAARATTVGRPEPGEVRSERPSPLPRASTRWRRSARGRRGRPRRAARRRADGAPRPSRSRASSARPEPREERHEPGGDGQRRAEAERAQMPERGPGQEHVAQRARMDDQAARHHAAARLRGTGLGVRARQRGAR